jgi:hypothetical protein
MRVLAVLLFLVMTSSACATGGAATSGQRNVIATAELEEFPTLTIYDVVERRRPEWLRSRGPISLSQPGAGLPVVYLNNSRHGDLQSLRSLRASTAAEVRFFSGSEATQRWGTGVAGGVIAVTLR